MKGTHDAGLYTIQATNIGLTQIPIDHYFLKLDRLVGVLLKGYDETDKRKVRK